MTPNELNQLRSGTPDCPSDVMLWRLHLDELPPDAAAAVRQHVSTCEVCAGRMAERQAGFDAWPEVDARRMLAAIRTGAARGPHPGRWRSRLRLLLVPIAILGAAGVVLVARTRIGPEASPDAVRAKGGAVLHVFSAADEGARRRLSGDHFKSGDRLQFSVDLPAPRRVELIGIEASGRLYRVWPEEPGTALMGAGSDQPLPPAVALDETAGTETLYLVTCPTDVVVTGCTSRGPSNPPACPAGCATTPFVLNKGR